MYIIIVGAGACSRNWRRWRTWFQRLLSAWRRSRRGSMKLRWLLHLNERTQYGLEDPFVFPKHLSAVHVLFFCIGAIVVPSLYVSSFCILTLFIIRTPSRASEHVCHHQKKAHEDRVHNKRHDPLQQRGRKIIVGKQPCESAKVYWFRWRRWRTSKWTWNFFKYATNCTITSFVILVMKTVTHTAHEVQWHLKDQDSTQIFTSCPMLNDIRGTQVCSSVWVFFALQCLKTENNRTYVIRSLRRLSNDHCTSMKWPMTTRTWRLKFLMELMVKQETCWNAVWLLAEGLRNKSQNEISCANGSISLRSPMILQTACWGKTSWVLILGWQRNLWSHWREKGNPDEITATRPMGDSPSRLTSKATSSGQWPDVY